MNESPNANSNIFDASTEDFVKRVLKHPEWAVSLLRSLDESLRQERRLHQGDHEILAIVTGDEHAYRWSSKQAQAWVRERDATDKAADEAEANTSKAITVCDACLRACCWQGEFMCDEAKGAGTVEKSREELVLLELENPEYWDLCPNCSAPTVECRCPAKHRAEHGNAK